MSGTANGLLLAVAAAALSTASVAAAPDDPIGDLIGRSLVASESTDGSALWAPGQRVGYVEWSNARSVDYRQHGLRPPQRGHEWRQINGQYVLAGTTTRLIVDVARPPVGSASPYRTKRRAQ